MLHRKIKCPDCGYRYEDFVGYCEPCEDYAEAASIEIHQHALAQGDEELRQYMEDGEALKDLSRKDWQDLLSEHGLSC